MNSQRQKINQQLPLKNTLTNQKIWKRAMEEEMEILREQVNSLKQLLYHEYKLTNEYVQELADTKQELEWMNEEITNLITLKKEPLDEANKLDKSFVRPKSISESMLESFNRIDCSPVKVNESEETDYLIVKTTLHKLKTQSCQLKNKSDQIKTRSTQIKSHSAQLANRAREIKVDSHEVSKIAVSPAL